MVEAICMITSHADKPIRIFVVTVAVFLTSPVFHELVKCI